MMNDKTSIYLGFDIGGTKSAVILGSQSEGRITILARESIPTDIAAGPWTMLRRLESLARTVLLSKMISEDDLCSVGISCGGPLDSRKGIILSPPNLSGWDEIPIAEYFSGRFNRPVRLRNDADACALAEWTWGAGKGTQNMIFLTFGTGMGAGLILGGRLHTGARDLAGEVGHIRLAEDGPMGYGKCGSFEGFCSGGGIAELGRDMARKAWNEGRSVSYAAKDEELALVSAHSVFNAAADGDPVAIKVVETTGRYLGRGLAVLVDILNPEVIVIGSIFARQQKVLWPLAEQVLKEESLQLSYRSCRVVPAVLGEQIGDYGSLAAALFAD